MLFALFGHVFVESEQNGKTCLGDEEMGRFERDDTRHSAMRVDVKYSLTNVWKIVSLAIRPHSLRQSNSSM